MTCRNGNRGVEAPSSLLIYCKSMKQAYKGGVEADLQILLEYLKCHSFIKYPSSIEVYNLILKTVEAIHTLKASVITCQVPAVYA